MKFEVVERDFIRRTLGIVDQYDNVIMKAVGKEEQYEVTLLINCLLGLIVTPFELKKRQDSDPCFPVICTVDSTPITDLDPEWGLRELKITKFVLKGRKIRPERVTLRQLVAMLRNSAAHSQFSDKKKARQPKGISVDYIDSSVAKDESQITNLYFYNIYDTTEFKANIPVEALRVFATKLASTVLAETK